MLTPWRKSNDKPRQHVWKQKYHFADNCLYSQSYGFFSRHVWIWELDHKARWVLKNGCFWTVVLEKTLENLLDCKEIKPVNAKGNVLNIHWNDWCCLSWISNTLVTWCKEWIYWKKNPDGWERLKVGGEGDNRGWDGWMVSLTHWTWVWACSMRCWRTGKPDMLQSMESYRGRHYWATE